MDGKNNKKRLLIILVVICIVIAAVIVALIAKMLLSSDDKVNPETKSSVSSVITQPKSEPQAETIYKSETEDKSEKENDIDTQQALISNDVLISQNGYMVKISDGSVVLDKGSQERIYPASMTKVMTAFVAIENLPDLDEEITMTQEIIDELYVQKASMAGFVNDERVTVRDLLYGVILPSGGEACLALSNRIAGSDENFAQLMNQKAAELGMNNTHFTNSTGLHDDQHYTTCQDIEILFKAALENDTFYQIITADEYRCRPDEYYTDGLYMRSTMFKMLADQKPVNNALILGGKTGTTDEAGYCLVSFADYNGERYILVTGNAPIDDSQIHYNITDALNAYGAL